MVNITSFDGITFCAKRSEENFKDIRAKIVNHFGYNNYTKDDLRRVDKSFFKDHIIVAAYLVNVKHYPGWDPKEGNTKKGIFEFTTFKITNELYFFISYVLPEGKDANAHIDHALVDLKLFNHFWCAYSDFSQPFVTPEMISKSKLSYGYSYCDSMAIKQNSYFADNYARTYPIVMDPEKHYTKAAFYNDQIMKYLKMYDNVGLRVPHNSFEENVVVGEHWFAGFGCKAVDQVDLFIMAHKIYPRLREVGAVALFFLAGLTVISLVFQCCYVRKNNRCLLILTIIMLILSFLTFLLEMAYLITTRLQYDLISEYIYTCNNSPTSTNFNHQNTSTMQFEHLEGLKHLRNVSGLECLILVGNLASLVLYLFACRCWNVDESNENNEQNQSREFDKVPNQKL